MGLLDRFEEEFSGIVKDTTEASAELDQKDKNNRDYIFKLKQLRDLVEYLNQVELLLQEFLTQNFHSYFIRIIESPNLPDSFHRSYQP